MNQTAKPPKNRSDAVSPPGGRRHAAGARQPTAQKKRRGPRKVSPKSLENAALFYLARFSASSGHLRQVLLRRVERSVRAHGTDPVEGRTWVDQLVARLVRSGLVDDAAYAAGRVRSLRRRGASRSIIARNLRAKQVGAAEIAQALAADDAEVGSNAELAAAIRLAQRKRLGPFRPTALRAERRDRDLAAMARAGFGYALARRVIDADNPDTLQDGARQDPADNPE